MRKLREQCRKCLPWGNQQENFWEREKYRVDIVLTICCVIVLVLLWSALYDSYRFVVVHHTFTDRRILKSCRAVVLSDLHNKSFGKDNCRLLAAIREAKPDMILIAGDMLTARPGAVMDTAIRLIRELAEEYPIYYGNGNHEHRLELYPENYGDMAQRYGAALKEAHVRLLVNAHVEIEGTGIVLYGAQIDKSYYKRFRVRTMKPEYMDTLLGRPDRSCFTVLLAHNPDYFPEYAGWGADVTFSGHVHGGVVRIPLLDKGVLSPAARIFPKYDGGLFGEGTAKMVLSRGLGMHTIPVRLFNPGELIVVDFRADGFEEPGG